MVFSGAVGADESVAEGNDFEVAGRQPAESERTVVANGRPGMPLRRVVGQSDARGRDVDDEAPVIDRARNGGIKLSSENVADVEGDGDIVGLAG